MANNKMQKTGQTKMMSIVVFMVIVIIVGLLIFYFIYKAGVLAGQTEVPSQIFEAIP
jgi:hypothetical protein